MQFADRKRLLDPSPLPLEMGYERLDTGVLHIAVRTDMPGCKGKMLDWWFGWFDNTQKYVWWHPTDHVSSSWDDAWSPGSYVGSTNIVKERMSTPEVHDVHIHFLDPADVFGADELARAKAEGKVSAIVVAQTGIGEEPFRDEQGRPCGAFLCHVVRDTEWGAVLRSHFWLGEGGPLDDPDILAEVIPDEAGPGIVRHAYNEFTYLSHLLPSLYIAERRDIEAPRDPWPE
ncbi:MAG: hypothetical protein GXP35_06110 [Actinobacteria bacterium]|nr:hypothetical protein [Actinomycetota bacterium]